MSNWLNYHHLMYFKTIATEGSIAKASEKLLVGQPALSAQLKTLEEHLGEKLFERKNRRLILTEAGKIALKYSKQIFDMGEELMAVLKDQSFSLKANLNIGALDSVPKSILIHMVAEARKKFPCHITVLEGNGDELMRELSNHNIDMILSNYDTSTQDKSNVYSRSLGKHAVSVFAHNKFKDLKKKFPKSLHGQPFILPTSHSKLRHDIEHYFDVIEIRPDMVAETQDTSLQKSLGINGLGLLPLPDFTVTHSLKEKKLVKIGTLENVFEEYWLISSKRIIENPVASEIMKNFSFHKSGSRS